MFNIINQWGESVDFSQANRIAAFCNAELIRLLYERKAYQITTGTQRLPLTRVARFNDLRIHVSDENF